MDHQASKLEHTTSKHKETKNARIERRCTFPIKVHLFLEVHKKILRWKKLRFLKFFVPFLGYMNCTKNAAATRGYSAVCFILKFIYSDKATKIKKNKTIFSDVKVEVFLEGQKN